MWVPHTGSWLEGTVPAAYPLVLDIVVYDTQMLRNMQCICVGLYPILPFSMQNSCLWRVLVVAVPCPWLI